MSNRPTNNMAVISAVLGILGIIGLLPLIGSIGAIICGHMARSQIAAHPEQEGSGLAMVGLITGYLAVLMLCVTIAVAFLWFGGIAAFLAFLGIAGAVAGA